MPGVTAQSSVLVCGGAGYIGAHLVRELRVRGVDVVVFDDFSTGHAQAVAGVPVVRGRLQDPADLDRAFTSASIGAVVHFAAKALVGESVVEPLMYYDTNVVGTLRLLQAMRRHAVQRLVFSSSCAVYGHPEQARIDESHPLQPANPYGASKLMCERMLADCCNAYGMRSVALRYFNAAGASADGTLGESHSPETHLIPNAIKAALGQSPALTVHGMDYPTPDGTCVRDYIHVSDLVSAHLLALDWVDAHPGAHAFNLGTQSGLSVLAVIAAVESAVGRPVPWRSGPRRPGDPAQLIANAAQAADILGWAPSCSDADSIVASALRWHKNPRY